MASGSPPWTSSTATGITGGARHARTNGAEDAAAERPGQHGRSWRTRRCHIPRVAAARAAPRQGIVESRRAPDRRGAKQPWASVPKHRGTRAPREPRHPGPALPGAGRRPRHAGRKSARSALGSGGIRAPIPLAHATSHEAGLTPVGAISRSRSEDHDPAVAIACSHDEQARSRSEDRSYNEIRRPEDRAPVGAISNRDLEIAPTRREGIR